VQASRDTALRERMASLEMPRPPIGSFDWNVPVIMGIVNVTPDSFSDGGKFDQTETAIAHGRNLLARGAHILDVGGESTRPGSDPVGEAEELRRVLPVIEALTNDGAYVSCDTRKSGVMTGAAKAGAQMLNDVTALTHEPNSLETASGTGLPVVLMHSQGEPKTMQQNPTYDDVCLDIFDALAEKIERCVAGGIPREKLIADPGIGFGKTYEHNLQLMDGLALFHGLGVPLMLGVSRKKFIGVVTGIEDAQQRVTGSVAAALAGLAQGVQMFRVHDADETAQAFKVWSAIGRNQT
ncbi:MAG: dihydropteroate synthase, partial [Hyphomicrobiales bacterium]